MLNMEAFVNGMKDLIYFYPSWNIAVEEKEAMERWYEMFKHIDDDMFKRTVREHARTIRYNPSVSTLLEVYTKVRPKVELDDGKPKVPEEFKDWY